MNVRSSVLFSLLTSSIIGSHAAHANTCGTGVATGFDYPLSNWDDSCGFDETCARAHHMGVDGVPASGAVVDATVVAPCSGKVMEAQTHSGYGGMVIFECWTGTECVTPFVAHLDVNTLTVSAGDTVQIGQEVGKLGDSSEIGGWVPHAHYGIRKGSYASANYSCSGSSVWYYAGYPGDCYSTMLGDMYDPDQFIQDHPSSCEMETTYSDPKPITMLVTDPDGSQYDFHSYYWEDLDSDSGLSNINGKYTLLNRGDMGS